ncbi:MAG: inorganic diphosphatase [Clostridia bacterium]|nr:inorganic diphosphatase [Clostridia bacterium]
MTLEERKKQVRSYLGRVVRIEIDRPIGYVHQKQNYTLEYKINYGYIPNVIGGDGEELDVYLLGVDTPVEEYTARIIAISHRENDVEDKLVACPPNMDFTEAQVMEYIAFQEKYYDTHIEML